MKEPEMRINWIPPVFIFRLSRYFYSRSCRSHSSQADRHTGLHAQRRRTASMWRPNSQQSL